MKRNALTLIELLIAATIIGILVALVLPFLAGGTSGGQASGEIVGTVITISYDGWGNGWKTDLSANGNVCQMYADRDDLRTAAQLRKASRLSKTVVLRYEHSTFADRDYVKSVQLVDEKGGTSDLEVSPKDMDDMKAMMGK